MKKILLITLALLAVSCTPINYPNGHGGTSTDDSDTIYPLDAVNPASPTFGSTSYPSQLYNSLSSENAGRSVEYGFPNFVYDGVNASACLGAAGSGLTMTPISCIAYNAGFRSTETGSITFSNSQTTWVAMDENTSGNNANLPNFTRVGTTHYLIDTADASQPAMASDSQLLMKVVTSGGSITSVSDLRNVASQGSFSTYVGPVSITGNRNDGSDQISHVNINGQINAQTFGAVSSLIDEEGLTVTSGSPNFSYTGQSEDFVAGSYVSIANQGAAPSISAPGAPTITQHLGVGQSAGTTDCSFSVAAIDPMGGVTAVGSTTTISTCSNPITRVNYPTITIMPVAGAVAYAFFGCSGTSCTQKLIATSADFRYSDMGYGLDNTGWIAWPTSTLVTQGTLTVQTVSSVKYLYRVVTPGTTGGSAPAWPVPQGNIQGSLVHDGLAVWYAWGAAGMCAAISTGVCAPPVSAVPDNLLTTIKSISATGGVVTGILNANANSNSSSAIMEHDAATPIINAINYVHSNYYLGGEVYLPTDGLDGGYNIPRTICVNGCGTSGGTIFGITLAGESKTATQLFPSAYLSGAPVVVGTDIGRSTFRDIGVNSADVGAAYPISAAFVSARSSGANFANTANNWEHIFIENGNIEDGVAFVLDNGASDGNNENATMDDLQTFALLNASVHIGAYNALGEKIANSNFYSQIGIQTYGGTFMEQAPDWHQDLVWDYDLEDDNAYGTSGILQNGLIDTTEASGEGPGSLIHATTGAIGASFTMTGSDFRFGPVGGTPDIDWASPVAGRYGPWNSTLTIIGSNIHREVIPGSFIAGGAIATGAASNVTFISDVMGSGATGVTYNGVLTLIGDYWLPASIPLTNGGTGTLVSAWNTGAQFLPFDTTNMLPADTQLIPGQYTFANLPFVYKNLVLANSPISYFRLDESSGNFVNIGSSAAAGTAHGTITYSVAGSITDDSNTQVTLGAAGYATVGTTGSPTSGAVSFDGAIAGTWGTATRTIFEQDTGGIGFAIEPDGRLFIIQNGFGSVLVAPSSTALADTNEHFVAMGYDGSSTGIICLDGKVVATGGLAVSLSSDGGFDLGNNPGGTSYLLGSLDEAAVYSTMMTGAICESHYQTWMATKNGRKAYCKDCNNVNPLASGGTGVPVVYAGVWQPIETNLSVPPAIGDTTPNTGAFSLLTLSGVLRPKQYIVSALPATCTLGDVVEVTDATSLTPGACTGSGTDATLAICQGSNVWNCL